MLLHADFIHVTFVGYNPKVPHRSHPQRLGVVMIYLHTKCYKYVSKGPVIIAVKHCQTEQYRIFSHGHHVVFEILSSLT
jgi:hypothetical protein